MLKKFLLMGSVVALSSVVMAEGIQSVTSSVAISENKVNEGRYFYLADNYHEMAALPSFTMSAPAGLVPGGRVAFIGIAGSHNSVEGTDGGLGFGIGYGNPYETVGGAISVAVGSIDPRDGGAFNRGNLNLSLGHTFKQYGFGVSVGMTGTDLWHDKSDEVSDPSFYGAVTKLLPNDVAPVVLTAGLGNNVYADTNASGDKKDKVYPFFAVATYIIPQLSLIADYTNGVTILGVGIVPSPKLPITITLGAYDISKQGNQNTISFIGSLSTAYAF